MRAAAFLTLSLSLALPLHAEPKKDIVERVEHHHADSDGVKIHYVSLGGGVRAAAEARPLVVMIHGFPDFWYSWRHQMEALSAQYRCVAMDLRGYNKSDKPKGKESYDIRLLVADVAAVIRHTGNKKAIIVGHDWGGFVGWSFAMQRPEMTERLVICNLPHPRGITRELVNNPEQKKNSQYARNFQKKDAHKALRPEFLALLVAKNPTDLKRYVAALKRSDAEAMLNYYKQNYPREPYGEALPELPKVKVPVLMFHGLNDPALLPGGLNDTWKWLEKDLTLVTVPGAGHWVHHDAAKLVSRTMEFWLGRDRP